MKKYLFSYIMFILIIIGLVLFLVESDKINNQVNSNVTQISSVQNTQPVTQTVVSNQTVTQVNDLTFPIDQFKERITKKFFGTYVTPQNSPISPERFTGHHTGVDIEYQDVMGDVSVFAITDGTVIASQWVSGYGGVIILRVKIAGVDHNVLYGHLWSSSMVKIGYGVTRGEKMGVFSTGYSAETDDERRHLHFSVLSDNRIDYKGYVQTKSELSGWIDPMTLYK